ncbi:MAG: hypothetical protein O3B44_06820 [Bacteroidetes bacterium]|nr:hypothetical protein [Bacteroidota bacterium]
MQLERAKIGLSVIFEGTDLLSVDGLKGMCYLDSQIRTISSLPEFCERSWETGECMPSRGLHNYFTALSFIGEVDVTCNDLTAAHVSEIKALLTKCRPYYDDKKLVGNCWDWWDDSFTSKFEQSSKYPACDLPAEDEDCARWGAVFDSFIALTPSGFWSNGEEPLKRAQMIIPAYDNGDMLGVCLDDIVGLIGRESPGGAASITIIYMESIKGALFNARMMQQSTNFIILFIVIYLLVLWHTGSFWITTNGMIQIVFAFLWGFVIYVVVLWCR